MAPHLGHRLTPAYLSSALAALFAVAAAVVAPSPGPIAAGSDVCPEPNDARAAACSLGPGAPAAGFLDTPDDVDNYRLELVPDAMIVATLSGLQADYGLRLLTADGSTHAEALDPGRSDKVIRADGLTPGTYYLAVNSPRGEAYPDQPYLVGVSYPPSIVLGNPAAPGGPGGEPSGAQSYVPAPASGYGLQAGDVGAGFREVERSETEDGRRFSNRLVAADATPFLGGWTSRTDVSAIDTYVMIEAYGRNAETAAELDAALRFWKERGLNVQPAVGWGSQHVYSYAMARGGVMSRGIALQHYNAIVLMQTYGNEQHATWERMSRLMGIVEGRIHAAVQRAEGDQ